MKEGSLADPQRILRTRNTAQKDEMNYDVFKWTPATLESTETDIHYVPRY